SSSRPNAEPSPVRACRKRTSGSRLLRTLVGMVPTQLGTVTEATSRMNEVYRLSVLPGFGQTRYSPQLVVAGSGRSLGMVHARVALLAPHGFISFRGNKNRAEF